jgi:hypothetical protein
MPPNAIYILKAKRILLREMHFSNNKNFINVQTTGPDKIKIYHDDGKIKECDIKEAGGECIR